MRPMRRRVVTTAAIVIAVLLIAFFARHAIVGTILSRGLSIATGYDIHFDRFRLGREHGAFFGVHVTKNGDPFLDTQRVDVSYQLRDIFPGGAHRFGFAALSLDAPVFSLVRHVDGGYNLGGTGNAPNATSAPTQTQAAAAPYLFTVRVRDGKVRLIDRAPMQADLAEQDIEAVTLDASVKSDTRITARGSGVVVTKRRAGTVLRRWPVTVRSTIDYERGIAVNRLQARTLPIRGLLGFVLHSPAFRVDDGIVTNLDIHLYALDIHPDRQFNYRLGGQANLASAGFTIGALQQPLRDGHGALTLVNDGLWTTRFAGTLAGLPVIAQGGVFDLAHPTIRLGVAGDGELADLRTLFGFSQRQPVRGRLHVETVLESDLGRPLIRSVFRAPNGSYGAVPFTALRGGVDYWNGAVVLDGIAATYGAASLHVGGRFLLGPTLDSAIVFTASGPGSALPFAENLAPESSVDALALITGYGGFRARGALAAQGHGVDGRGFFDVNERGVGEFGPFTFARADGSSLIGALRLERPTSESAGWLSARAYRVNLPTVASRLAGLKVPAFPPLAGVVDAALAGGGTPGAFAVAGSVDGRGLRVAGLQLGSGSAHLGGTLADLRLGDLRIAGPLGRFGGAGVVAGGTLALSGQYDGSLDALVPLTGNQNAHGALHGPVRATIVGKNVVVQSDGATLHDASFRGVAVNEAAGTIAVRANRVHILAAHASIGGREVVAAESNGTVAVSAPDLPSAALHGTGLPLQAGNVSVFGRADLRGTSPAFDGTVAVADGRANGYPVSGDAQLDLRGPRLTISAATGALGSTFGSIGGRIGGVGERALTYDLDARVPLGDVDIFRRDIRLPVRYLDGSFAANLHVAGRGTGPTVSGDVQVPEGSYNGLAFRDARAKVVLDRFGVAAHRGTITVGTTRAAVDASAGPGHAFSVAARASQTDLADFNDYFDESETLQGRGRVDLAFRTNGGHIVTAGDLALADLRYRRFVLGTTAARWLTSGETIRARTTIEGPAGSATVSGSIVPRGGDPLGAFATARYDGMATVTGVDLSTWLPAAGYHVPVLGIVDAQGTFDGRFPRIGVRGDASLRNGSIAGLAVRTAHLRAQTAGSRIAITGSNADLVFVQLDAKGSVGLAVGDPLALDVHAQTPDVGRALHALVPPARALDIAGALEADVRVTGTVAKPEVAGGFDLRDARYSSLKIPRAIGVIGLKGNAFELRDAEILLTKGEADVAGSLPLQLMPFAIGPAHAPLSFDVRARGIDLAQFSPLLPVGTKLGGTVDGRFGVEGSVDRPRLLGALAIANGSYVSTFERAPIQHVNAGLAFAGTSVALQVFHAGVGKGTLDGSGRLDLPFGGNPHPGYAIDLKAKGAQLDFPAYGRGRADGALKLTSGPQGALLSGTMALSDAVIPFAAIYGSNAGAGAAGGGAPLWLDPSFDLHITAGRNVRVRSSIVDIGATGGVALTGSLTRPRLDGAFTSTGGTISSYNHVFSVVSGVVNFNAADGIVPTIEARAVAHVTDPDPDPSRNIAGSANITVTVSGAADSNNLQVSYSSNPPYTQEQIVGLLLDVPALLGAVNFGYNQGPGGTLLRGAPGETNVLLPPGVTPEQIGTISFNQEVFSLLNGQFTQRALSPAERVFERVLGLSEVQFTVDYGGGVGYSVRRQIGKRDFYAFLSQTVSFPERSNIGFELQSDPVTSVDFSYYRQNGITSLITTTTPGEFFFNSHRLTSIQPLGNRDGFNITLTRRVR